MGIEIRARAGKTPECRADIFFQMMKQREGCLCRAVRGGIGNFKR